MKTPKIFNDLIDLFLPAASVGGLQITDSSIRFLELKEDGGKTGVLKSASLRLPPGIIQNGRVKDKNAFISALNNVHSQVEKRSNKNVNVIVTIPTGDIYAEAFSLPPLHGSNLNEAVELNLKMVSPNPIDQSYYSWQQVAGGGKEAGPIEILGSFVAKEAIDDLSYCLASANFGIAAIEFSSLSMARMLSVFNVIKQDKPYLLVKLTEEGLIFMILRNGHLYFDYFHSWGKFNNNSGGVTVGAITQIIKAESARVLNFYTSRWGGQIKNIIIIAPALLEEIAKFIRISYPEFEIVAYSSSRENLHGVRGAALRGLSMRGADSEINLMNPKGLSAFWQDEILNFVGLWRNVVVTILVFVVFLYGAGDVFLRSKAEYSSALPDSGLSAAETAELASLKQEATSFNTKVAVLGGQLSQINPVYPIISAINNSINSGVFISRFSISSTGDVSIDGAARDNESVRTFQKILPTLRQVQNLNFPISNIVTRADGQVSFSLSFQASKQPR